mgnify:CR=1 FL=1
MLEPKIIVDSPEKKSGLQIDVAGKLKTNKIIDLEKAMTRNQATYDKKELKKSKALLERDLNGMLSLKGSNGQLNL